MFLGWWLEEGPLIEIVGHVILKKLKFNFGKKTITLACHPYNRVQVYDLVFYLSSSCIVRTRQGKGFINTILH